jgi:4,5:9,10-diseco-3-hydroxy-5,9,17-trioxoandrosta-1(10),2-diene-4-oate hydrolase
MFPAGAGHVRVRNVTLRSGLVLRVAESGERGNAPVLLIHGWGASIFMWRAWFAPMAAAGRHVIAVDLPGHGLSDKPDDPQLYRVEELTEVVRELIELEGLAPTDVVAQSMGGTIALELATIANSPVRRLVLINPAAFGRVRLQRLARLVSPSRVDSVLPHLVPRWIVARAHRLVYGDPSRISTRDIDEYWAPSQFPGFARAMRMLVHQFSWSRLPAGEMAKRIGPLKTRVLVILGTRDRLVREAGAYVEALRAVGTSLEVKIIAGGGHAVNEERADEVVPLTLAFLDRQLSDT